MSSSARTPSDLERSLRKARQQIQQLNDELELTSRGVTALTLDLERAQERFRLLVENVRAAFRLTTPSGDEVLYASPMFEKIWGRSADAVAMDPSVLLESVHPEDRERATQQLLQPDFEDPTARFRIVLPDDEVRWVQDQIYSVPAEGSASGYLAAITEDVTGEHLARRRLQESEQRHRSLFQEHPDAVFAVDRRGRITNSNRAAAELAAEPADRLLDTPLVRFIPEEGRGEVKEAVKATIAEREPAEVVSRFLQESSLRDVRLTTLPILAPDGIEGAFVIARDITERNELERQLLHGRKMEAIGRLAGGIAHDFNNVLTAISGHVRLIVDEMESDACWREDIQEIGRSADRAADLTRQLLAFSRQQVLNPQVVDVDHLLHEMEPMLSRILGEDVDVQIRLDASDSRVKVDPGQVEQVVMNLAVNARDAMPKGGVLTIETEDVRLGEEYARSHADVSSGPHVVLRVTDTGVGMPPEVRDRIFDPFFTTKGPSEGTGLGLSTIYGIVRQSGGHIFVYSEPDHGTSFKLYFPITEDEVDPADRTSDEDDMPSEGGSETVLLTEDDDAVRKVVRRILERSGYTVVEAGSGAQALQIIDARGAAMDMLIADVVLPDRSGLELGEEVLRQVPDMPILYMSGYSDEVVSNLDEAQDRFSFLEKPFQPEDLLREIRLVLDFAGGGA